MKTTAATEYEITWTTNVDRPELRDTTFTVRSGAHYVTGRKTVFNYQAALSIFEELTGGQNDFASEFTSRARVIRLHAGRGKGWTNIRSTYRVRKSDGKIVQEG